MFIFSPTISFPLSITCLKYSSGTNSPTGIPIASSAFISAIFSNVGFILRILKFISVIIMEFLAAINMALVIVSAFLFIYGIHISTCAIPISTAAAFSRHELYPHAPQSNSSALLFLPISLSTSFICLSVNTSFLISMG